MEEFRIDEHRCKGYRKHEIWQYLGIALITLIGSFLAFYFVITCTMSQLLSTHYIKRQMHEIKRNTMHDLDEIDNKFMSDRKARFFQHKNIIDLIKTPDSYKFIVDLIPFQGNQNAIHTNIDKNIITISGETENNKNFTETFIKISQTYVLGKGAKTEKISKKKVNDKYIITVPIEDY